MTNDLWYKIFTVCSILLQKQIVNYRSVLLVSFGLLSLFGSNRAELSGAGALGVLTLGAVSGYGWNDNGKVTLHLL